MFYTGIISQLSGAGRGTIVVLPAIVCVSILSLTIFNLFYFLSLLLVETSVFDFLIIT